MKTLAKNAAFSLLYQAGNVAFPLLSGMYLTRILSADTLGQVAYIRNTASYFLLLAAMGIPRYAIRETARCREDRDALQRLVSELLVLQLAAGLISMVGYGLLLRACSPGERVLYGIFSLELIFQLGNLEWLFEGREEYRFIALRNLGVRTVSFLALLIFVHSETDAARYALILCLGTGGNHLLNLFYARIRLTFLNLHPLRHIRPVLVLMVSGLAASLYSKVDITMLGLLADHAAVGYYTNGYKVVLLVLTLMTSVTAVFFPRLSRSGPEDVARYTSAALKLLLVLTIPASVGLALVADKLTILLFGKAFAPAADCIRILAPMILIRGCGDLLCYQTIISAGKEKLLIQARIWAGVANVVLNGILIPRLGHSGAALATLLSEAAVNGILLPQGLRIGKPNVKKGLLLRVLAASGIMGLVVLWIQNHTAGTSLQLLLSVAAGAGIYGIIVGFGEIYGTEKYGKDF